MPCTYTGSLMGDRVHSAEMILDRRERMLCAICSHIEQIYGAAALHTMLRKAGREASGLAEQDISQWWLSHKKAEGRT
jgi:hypothetical protein